MLRAARLPRASRRCEPLALEHQALVDQRLRGHGALYMTGTTAPPRNDSSDFTGKPPFGHFFGIMP